MTDTGQDCYDHVGSMMSLDSMETDDSLRSWAYRIIIDGDTVSIQEVYFDEHGEPQAWTDKEVSPCGYDTFSPEKALQELKDDYELIGLALESQIYQLVREGDQERLELY